ncbi:unnamed protein product (macronuclear) [Paramecium tetraurelia]|uniref:Transmembrane protein n=1 Tax=Paramecium tetraurelia TaxID=5888 RepID=A0BJF7_PARTE|nr:uncharacterized protein GSPATT00029301001 [Paramecium tetraurelia]CAK58674.1 unnamed protein product [Paramecium tetraurelia]|eukprot:XP_001426072.1 hypothetical protein (macronuclear) [Paramecium tetraurelia strain d4-2]
MKFVNKMNLSVFKIFQQCQTDIQQIQLDLLLGLYLIQLLTEIIKFKYIAENNLGTIALQLRRRQERFFSSKNQWFLYPSKIQIKQNQDVIYKGFIVFFSLNIPKIRITLRSKDSQPQISVNSAITKCKKDYNNTRKKFSNSFRSPDLIFLHFCLLIIRFGLKKFLHSISFLFCILQLKQQQPIQKLNTIITPLTLDSVNYHTQIEFLKLIISMSFSFQIQNVLVLGNTFHHLK